MTDTAPQPFLCDACGVTDDHPMIHVSYGSYQKDERTIIVEPSFHFDCLPAQYRAELEEDPAAHAVTLAAIAAAEQGTKGDDLRAFIQSQPSDNEQPEG